MHTESHYILQGVRAGAKGVVLKTHASEDLVRAIREASRGGTYMSSQVSSALVQAPGLAPQLAATPWGGSPPRPLCQKICYQTAQKTALCAPWEHPGGFGIRKSASNSGHSPLRGLGGGLGDASPARRGSRSRPPLRRPRPLRFERLRMSGSECGIHTAEAASALRSRKTERAAEEKPMQPHNFFKHLPSGRVVDRTLQLNLTCRCHSARPSAGCLPHRR